MAPRHVGRSHDDRQTDRRICSFMIESGAERGDVRPVIPVAIDDGRLLPFSDKHRAATTRTLLC